MSARRPLYLIYIGNIIGDDVQTLRFRGELFDSFVYRHMLTREEDYNFMISYMAMAAVPFLVLFFSIKRKVRERIGRGLMALVMSGNFILYPVVGTACIMSADKPVEIRYKLSDIPENEAVMVAITCVGKLANGLERWNYTIVNKEGRYKYISEDALSVLEEKYLDEDYYDYKYLLYDEVLRMESIPYEADRIEINPYYLQRAVNMEEVEIHTWNGVAQVFLDSYYMFVRTSDGREPVIYKERCAYTSFVDKALTPQYMNKIFADIAEKAKKDLGKGRRRSLEEFPIPSD